MARVVVFTPDLLFGSSLLGALVAGGHEGVMCSNREALDAEVAGCSVLIVDLTDEAQERAATIAEVKAAGVIDGVPTLGYHSHVDPESRESGLEAGIDKVVPRSRMHREPVALVEALITD